MAKHANGKNNYKLSGGAIAVLVALALFIAVVIWWVAGRGSQNQESQAQECVAGELTLPIAAADTEAGHSLIDAYGETHPVVRDYCVRAELVDDVSDAAVYLAPTPVCPVKYWTAPGGASPYLIRSPYPARPSAWPGRVKSSSKT